jgi:hypothetical protein
MTNEKPTDAAAEWAETERALQAAYKLIDTARERESMNRADGEKLLETIKTQADALARMSSEKSPFRRALEYLVLLVILALAADLLYLGHELEMLLH